MDIKTLTSEFSVSGQLTAADLKTVAAMGYRTLINNRPDGESPDQPPAAEIEHAARAAGLEYSFIPVIAGQLVASQLAAFADVMETAPGPVLAFCRSGARSEQIWRLAGSR